MVCTVAINFKLPVAFDNVAFGEVAYQGMTGIMNTSDEALYVKKTGMVINRAETAVIALCIYFWLLLLVSFIAKKTLGK